MADPLVVQLRRTCAGTVTADAPLAPLTTLKVGGAARVSVQAASVDDLAAIGAACRDHGVPWLVVGRGSNLLVADTGFPGVAITLGRAFRGVEVDGTRVRVGAAEPLPILALRCAEAGLRGLAFGAAIPGSVGGAVRMNAGAHGREIRDVLLDAQVVRLASGEGSVLTRDELDFSYRHSALPHDAVVTAGTFELEPGDVATEHAEIAEVKSWRRAHQPINHPSCGSVFTNPPGDSAGRLV
ncbi:MAG TPA: FAD-binding protein, partial [Solirubrobacteraceae bacterium]|nr:FAD-binding protein [Solirubrobacteraceae bacterium]